MVVVLVVNPPGEVSVTFTLPRPGSFASCLPSLLRSFQTKSPIAPEGAVVVLVKHISSNAKKWLGPTCALGSIIEIVIELTLKGTEYVPHTWLQPYVATLLAIVVPFTWRLIVKPFTGSCFTFAIHAQNWYVAPGVTEIVLNQILLLLDVLV